MTLAPWAAAATQLQSGGAYHSTTCISLWCALPRNAEVDALVGKGASEKEILRAKKRKLKITDHDKTCASHQEREARKEAKRMKKSKADEADEEQGA